MLTYTQACNVSLFHVNPLFPILFYTKVQKVFFVSYKASLVCELRITVCIPSRIKMSIIKQ